MSAKNIVIWLGIEYKRGIFHMKYKDCLENEKLVKIASNKKEVENLDFIAANLNPRFQSMHEKISGYRDITRRELFETLKENDMLSIIAKEPGRQGIHENAFRSLLNAKLSKLNWSKLNNSGNGALYLNQIGLVVKKSDSSRYTKSLDFRIKSNSKTCYVMHKYVEQAGGAQDNQVNDMRTFLDCASKNKDSGLFFAAVLDGEYGEKCSTSLKNDFANYKNILIYNADDFVKYIGSKLG